MFLASQILSERGHREADPSDIGPEEDRQVYSEREEEEEGGIQVWATVLEVAGGGGSAGREIPGGMGGG